MSGFKIGVMADSLGLPLYESLECCARLGADGVQLYAVSGEMSPEGMTPARRGALKKRLGDCGLTVSALCGDFGGHGFTRRADNPRRIEASERVLDLALSLDCPVVTTHVGVVPADTDSETYRVLQEACGQLAEYARRVGGHFAIETGPEPATRLRAFLDSLGAGGGMAVNLDPANLVMVTGDDPVKAPGILGGYIVHTHAKDGVMKKKTDPQIIYDFFAEGGIGDLRLDEYFLETPLGEGDVNFPAYLKALRDAGYNGFLTIERETGARPQSDIAMAVDFLRARLI